MRRIRPLSVALVVLTAVAVACGGAAAPTATPTARPAAPAPAATQAPAVGATPTRPAAAAISTPTPTRAAVATQAPAPSGPVGKMVMAATADITNADPHVATGGGLQAFYSSDVFAPLLSQLKPGPSQPWLAESWSWDEKGLKVRFVIRKGAKFHDGKPVTADDIKFSVEKAKSPYAARGINSSQSPWMKDLQVVDDRTVVFTAREINALAYGLFGGLIT
ncbi:MAG: hypothetical protein HY330_02425, partial [Chloroflexi bacterium]|nr:hypothetical protein [Chloroflexota bacterium]